VQPDPAGPRERLIRFVTDRPGHDFRYEIDPTRSEAALDWTAPHDFEPGWPTVDWYMANRAWWQAVRAGRYGGDCRPAAGAATPAPATRQQHQTRQPKGGPA
jgi:dTDP-glucose 4,6-dehydratase